MPIGEADVFYTMKNGFKPLSGKFSVMTHLGLAAERENVLDGSAVLIGWKKSSSNGDLELLLNGAMIEKEDFTIKKNGRVKIFIERAGQVQTYLINGEACLVENIQGKVLIGVKIGENVDLETMVNLERNLNQLTLDEKSQHLALGLHKDEKDENRIKTIYRICFATIGLMAGVLTYVLPEKKARDIEFCEAFLTAKTPSKQSDLKQFLIGKDKGRLTGGYDETLSRCQRITGITLTDDRNVRAFYKKNFEGKR